MTTPDQQYETVETDRSQRLFDDRGLGVERGARYFGRGDRIVDHPGRLVHR